MLEFSVSMNNNREKDVSVTNISLFLFFINRFNEIEKKIEREVILKKKKK